MKYQRFNIEQCPEMPWKNGGGTTREVVCHPAHSDMSHFNWRISIAKIDQDGPFSSFEGIDRTIMLLEGEQVRLQAKDGSFNHVLAQPLEPFSFSGEVGLDCHLGKGTTHDFNVMTRRDQCQSQTAVVRNDGTFDHIGAGLLLAAEGTWSATFENETGIHQEMLTPHDGIWWQDEARQITLHPQSQDAAMIMVQIKEVTTKD